MTATAAAPGQRFARPGIAPPAATAAQPDNGTVGLPGARVELRARTPWEAVDLGTALLRQHAVVLYASWLIVVLPFVGVMWLLPREMRSWIVLLIWWLKPLFERLTVLCLSRELFGERMPLGALLRAFVRSLRVQPIATLLWRRFSPTRAIDQPVILLEGARGAVRSARLEVLHRNASRHALLSMVTLLHVESALALSLTFLLISMLPGTPADWGDALKTWVPIALTPSYVFAMCLVGPLHAACGFALYINRRCELEAWDIEVGFRRLAARLRAGPVARAGAPMGARALLLMVLLGAGSALLPVPRAQAEPLAQSAQSPLPAGTELTKRAARPRHAPPPKGAEAARSRQVVARVLKSADFHDRGSRTYPAFLEDLGSSKSDASKPLPRWLMALFSALVDVAWWLFWGVVLLLVVAVGWRYRHWLAELFDAQRRETGPAAIPMVVAGVSLDAESMREDSLDSARAVWRRGEARSTLAMLLRLTLVQFATQGTRFHSGDTEDDCLRATLRSQDAARVEYLRTLLASWVPVAYGHRTADERAIAWLLAEYPLRVGAPSS